MCKKYNYSRNNLRWWIRRGKSTNKFVTTRHSIDKPALKHYPPAASAILCYQVNPESGIALVSASPSFESLTGLNPVCLNSNFSLFYNHLHPEDKVRVQSAISQSTTVFKPWQMVFRYCHPILGVRSFEGHFIPQTGADGNLLYHGYMMDLSGLNQTLAYQEQLDHLLKLAFNSAPALISYLDTDFNYKLVNKAYEIWFHKDSKQIIGHNVRVVVGESVWHSVKPHLESALSGEISTFDQELLDNQAIPRWVQVTLIPDIDYTGKVEGIIAHIVNINERIQDRQKIALLNKSLQNRLEEMQAIFDTTPIGMLISFEAGAKQVFGNSVIRQMLGVSEQQIANNEQKPTQQYQIFHNGPELPVSLAPLQEALKGNKVNNQQLDIQRVDGQTVSVLSNAVPLINEDNVVRGAVGTFLDVTELKQTELALRGSEERLRLAIKAGAFGIFDHNLVTGAIQWDTKLREIWGLTENEPITLSTFMAGLHPDDYPAVKAAINQSLNAKNSKDYYTEYRIIRPIDKKTVTVAAFGTVTFDHTRPIRIIGFIQDISERKLAEIQLQETEARLTLTLEALSAGYWDWDLKTNEVYFSKVWKMQLGFEDDELPNQYCELENRLHPDDLGYFLDTVENHLNNHSPQFELEFRLLHKDGSYRWIHSRAALLRDASNLPLRMLGIHLDITEFKKLNELELQRKQVEESFRISVASQTAAAIAHELNQPLMAISHFADAAKDMLHNSDINVTKLSRVLESCSQQALRAGQVMRELLEVLHKVEIKIEALAINKIITATLNFMQFSDQQPKPKINLMFDPLLPKVAANALHIQKIILILLQNSLDALQQKENNSITIRTGYYRPDPKMAQISVTDSGPGVTEPSLLKKMFLPFYSTKSTGLGMGLAISRALVETHGGKMWAEQNANEGLSIHFTLPFIV
ncbi:MAG: PAS domain-containing protein [Methylococcaceae bacterium]|jgi:PAS domain S-box-containing protein